MRNPRKRWLTKNNDEELVVAPTNESLYATWQALSPKPDARNLIILAKLFFCDSPRDLGHLDN